MNHVHHEIVPQKNTLRRKIELPLNNNTFNYTLNKNISSYTNVNSIIERNKYLNNCKNINVNEENKDKVAQKDKINDNAVEENKQNVKKIPIGEGENYKKYTKANNNCSVNSSINFNSNTNIILNDTNNQIGKKITESSFKTKNTMDMIHIIWKELLITIHIMSQFILKKEYKRIILLVK